MGEAAGWGDYAQGCAATWQDRQFSWPARGEDEEDCDSGRDERSCGGRLVQAEMRITADTNILVRAVLQTTRNRPEWPPGFLRERSSLP